jgi:hypothetical protein
MAAAWSEDLKLGDRGDQEPRRRPQPTERGGGGGHAAVSSTVAADQRGETTTHSTSPSLHLSNGRQAQGDLG